MSSVGKAVSNQNRPRPEVDELAAAIGEMFYLYLKTIKPTPEH
jgi:hypothetical protein